jgi:hypothetical protein
MWRTLKKCVKDDLRIKLARLAGRTTGKLVNMKINKIIRENKKQGKRY